MGSQENAPPAAGEPQSPSKQGGSPSTPRSNRVARAASFLSIPPSPEHMLQSRVLSASSVRDHKAPKVDLEDGELFLFKHYLELVNQRIQVASAAYEAVSKTLAVLKSEWEKGSIDVTHDQYAEEVKNLQTQMLTHLSDKVSLCSTRWETAGRMKDIERWNKQDMAADWAYIDSLSSRMKEPSHRKVSMKSFRDPTQQERWQKAVIKAYDTEKSNGKFIWCPISQRWIDHRSVKVAHIVRHNVGEPSAVYLFGAYDGPEGHIWSLRNGIPLAPEYGRCLEDGQIAIVPTDDGNGLMVIVLSEEEMAEPADETYDRPRGKLLHRRQLKFLNDFRPAMRYLYFSFAINLLRRQRFEVEGWWKDHVRFPGVQSFATPDTWVRETTLWKLATRLGQLPKDEAKEFVAATKGLKLEDPFWDNSQGEGDAQPASEEEEEELHIGNIEVNVSL